ncbi:hypothetical protein Tco_0911734 [Tanacetum coccineum]|uniref:Uncharacterized protein n=1 Tax=Tanacetum coccineum TaxID=301880 RepID=A0ABQ5CXG2_9ASTR
MEQMSTLCDLVGQAIQKKEEEKRIAEEQAGKDRYWKIPICYDDDEDDTIGITPVLPIKEPDNNLIIKSSVEDLVPIPSESEGIPDKMCDVPLCENTTPLNALNKHSEIVVNSDDDNSSSDDDSPYGEDIDYVDASPPDVEIVSLEGVEIVDPEVGRIDDDILLTIKDDILREKLLNVNLLIAKIDALRDNPTPSSKISSGSPTTHSELSLPNYKAFYIDNDHFKEKSSGSTTTHVNFSQYDLFIFDVLNDHFPNADRSDFYREEFADELAHIMSLPNLECFKFKVDPDPGDLTSIDPGIRKNVSTTNVNVPLEDDQSSLFAYVVWILLLSNVSRMFFPSPHIFSPHGNEDAFLISAFSIYHSFMPDVSHRNGTFMNQCLSKRLKGSSMRIARIMKTIDVDSQFCPFIHKREARSRNGYSRAGPKRKPNQTKTKHRNGKKDKVKDKSEKNKDKHFVYVISIIDFSKDNPFSGSTIIHSDDPSPSFSPVKTSDNLEEFADELTLLKKDIQEGNFQVHSNPLFEFDDNFKSSTINPLFDELEEDVKIKNSNVSDEPVLLNTPLSDKKIICLLATFLNKKPKPLSRPQEVDDIKMKDDKVSSQIPIDTIVMPIRITFDNPIDFNDHFSKPKDLKTDFTIALDSTESSILPPPLLDSDSPFTAELSASFTLNSLGNEDKVFNPGILVYHTIHDKNLVTLEKNLRENISSGTLLFLKEPLSPRPLPEPPDVKKCLEPEAGILITKVFKGVSKPHDFIADILPTLPTLVSDLNFIFFPSSFLSFGSEDTIFDPGIITFPFSYLESVAFSMEVSCSKCCSP